MEYIIIHFMKNIFLPSYHLTHTSTKQTVISSDMVGNIKHSFISDGMNWNIGQDGTDRYHVNIQANAMISPSGIAACPLRNCVKSS